MSTLKSPTIICLPAHILDAKISPRAREVLMLLASQTTEQNPTVWVCQTAIAERLRCSAITVKRAIQKLVEAKLIDETGDLHEGRYKFYRVKWTLNEKKPVTRTAVQKTKSEDWMPEKPKPIARSKPTEDLPTPHPAIDQSALLKYKDIAHFAEIYGRMHQENLQRYRREMLSLS